MKKLLRRERGASTLEAAIILPLLLILALGTAEFGFAFVDWLSVANATRTGARIGSAAGAASTADSVILGAVGQALSDMDSSTVDAVWIYDASASGNPLDGCTIGSEGACTTTNVYVPSGGSGWNCVNGCPWTPALRDNKLPGLDRVGVRVIFTHSWLTSFLPLPAGPWMDDSGFQLEPAQGMGS